MTGSKPVALPLGYTPMQHYIQSYFIKSKYFFNAGAEGFGPTVTVPETVALPLGYAPMRKYTESYFIKSNINKLFNVKCIYSSKFYLLTIKTQSKRRQSITCCISQE